MTFPYQVWRELDSNHFERIADVKRAEEAAMLIAGLGGGKITTRIRLFGHMAGEDVTLWHEGKEDQPAYESYDHVANTCDERIGRALDGGQPKRTFDPTTNTDCINLSDNPLHDAAMQAALLGHRIGRGETVYHSEGSATYYGYCDNCDLHFEVDVTGPYDEGTSGAALTTRCAGRER